MKMLSILLLLFFVQISFSETCSKPFFKGEFSLSEKTFLLNTNDSEQREKFLDRIQKEYENTGFPGAKVYQQCKGDSLIFVNERGSGFVYGEPRNRYAIRTSKDVFAKLTGIVPGEKVALKDLPRAAKKLEQTGYFIETRKPELYREQGRNRLIPLFYMQEASNSYVEGVLTYSSDDNSWIGVLDVSLKNILGTARDLYIQGVSGEASHRVSVDYLEPWLFQTNWNGILRGFIEDDSLYSNALLELGVSRDLSFEWEFMLLGGVGNDEWTTSLEFSYVDFDSFVLPHYGTWLLGKLFWKTYRNDSFEDFVLVSGKMERFFSLHSDWICRMVFEGATLLPTSNEFAKEDLIRLGGSDSWKGFRKDFISTRAYGNTEIAIRFQGLWQTAFEVFYQPGVYRGLNPLHGWITEHQYGLGIIQYRSNMSISLYYALRPELRFEEGFLHLGVKALF